MFDLNFIYLDKSVYLKYQCNLKNIFIQINLYILNYISMIKLCLDKQYRLNLKRQICIKLLFFLKILIGYNFQNQKYKKNKIFVLKIF